MRTIAVISRKGGSGKTATAVNLAAALAEAGEPVLVVDLDPQGSATEALGVRPAGREAFDLMVGTRELGRSAVATQFPGLSLVPSSPWLATAERTLLGDLTVSVARSIQRLDRRWSFVIVDCPPSLSFLSVGALAGVHEVIIPVETHAISMTGVGPVLAEVVRLRGALNPHLDSVRIVPSRTNRTRHSRDIVDELQREYREMVTTTQIRESVRIAEAWAAAIPVVAYAPDSNVAHDFRALAREIAHPGSTNGSGPTGSWWRDLMPLVGAGR
ncbi:MAG: ParA family protein [Chloroflexota bacterium]